MTDLQTGTGVSSMAIPAEKQWDAGDRPLNWQGHVHGLVVHTTGSELPASATNSANATRCVESTTTAARTAATT
jgi:hypothetical protein